MQSELAEYRNRRVEVVAIGQASGQEAARFAKKWGVEFPILGDPKGQAYAAFGMLRGNWWSILFKALLTHPLESLRQIRKADLEGARLAAADVFRLGGVAIVSKGGVVRFLHKAVEPGDVPRNQDLFAAIDRL